MPPSRMDGDPIGQSYMPREPCRQVKSELEKREERLRAQREAAKDEKDRTEKRELRMIVIGRDWAVPWQGLGLSSMIEE